MAGVNQLRFSKDDVPTGSEKRWAAVIADAMRRTASVSSDTLSRAYFQHAPYDAARRTNPRRPHDSRTRALDLLNSVPGV
jgi:hypothetical protein